jgi:hypothetical protein
MPLAALPLRHQMQQMNALRGLALVLALVAGQLDLQARENGQPRVAVAHAHQAGVEVDLGREGGYDQEARAVYGHQGGHCLVEETLVHVRGILEYDDVAPGPLRRADLSREVMSNEITFFETFTQLALFYRVGTLAWPIVVIKWASWELLTSYWPCSWHRSDGWEVRDPEPREHRPSASWRGLGPSCTSAAA